MQIRNAEKEDFDVIMQIYASARAYMAAHGNPKQWGQTNWPPEDLIRKDIEEQKCYVCADGEDLLGVFYYNYGESVDPCYNRIEKGAWIGNETYGVVHRIASNGKKKGVGSFCINWAVEKSGHLRMDTHTDNKTMQNLLVKLGFQECGIVYVHEDNDPRIAYEIIKPE